MTGTFSEAAGYEFTTLTCVPGVIRTRGARIQLLDLPGIIEGAKDGKGRGRQVISTARTCNLILIVLDCLKPITHKRLIEHELEGFGIRLNKRPPPLTFRKKERGGISFTATADCKLDLDSVKAVCSECVERRGGGSWAGFGTRARARRPRCRLPLRPPPRHRIHNADVHARGDCDDDDLVDVIEGSR